MGHRLIHHYFINSNHQGLLVPKQNFYTLKEFNRFINVIHDALDLLMFNLLFYYGSDVAN